MSLEQLKDFLAKVNEDSSLQEKLKAAKSPEDVVGIAKEHGHEFTADKITKLSEEELEGVAGGDFNIWTSSIHPRVDKHRKNGFDSCWWS